MNTRYSTRRRTLLGCIAVLGALQVSGWGAILTNRYSFNEASGTTAVDSVSAKNGTLMNNTFSGTGTADCFSFTTSGDPGGQYVALPANLLTNRPAATVEIWLTPTLDDFTAGAFWARIFDFGNSDGTSGVNGFIWERVGNSSQVVTADMLPPAGGGVIGGTKVLQNGVENHVVWIADGPAQRGKIYINGVLAGVNDTLTANPVTVGATTNDWLGRSQFSADAYINASYNECRIYDGALNPLEVAADYQAGADTLSSGYGTITAIQLQIAPQIVVNGTTRAAVQAAASGLTNQAVNIADSSFAITYTSGDTNIVTVDPNGTVHANAVGTTSVIASYSSLNSTQSVTVFAAPTTLKNRYSFTSDASDSISAKDGTLQTGATISGGKVVLDGAGAYVDLPAYLIADTNFINGAFTIQAWVTVYPTSGAWGSLFSFGNTDGTSGFNYAFATPTTSAASRFAVGTLGSEDFVDGTAQVGATNVQFSFVYNGARNYMAMYINGALAASKVPVVSSISEINDAYSFIGHSLFSADPTMAGEVDEFRIYDGELDKFQVAATYMAGADNTNTDFGTLTSFVFGTGDTMPKDDVRQLTAILNFTAATNVNVATDAALTVTSSDPNVVSVSGGSMTAHNVGTATISANYAYVVGNTTNNFSTNGTITVFRNPATLQHRYTFETDGSDSVGTADGTAVGTASFTGGQLILDGATGTYLNLPGGLISSNPAVTLEAWVTYGTSGAWARLFDFGSTSGFGANETNGANNFFWCGQSATTFRTDISTTAGFANIDGAPALNNRTVHVVITYDPSNGMLIGYTNGVLCEANYNARVPLSSVSVDDAFIGKSQFDDPYLVANIDEVRIYNGVLYSDEVAASELLGTTQLLNTSSPTLTVVPSGGNIVLSWPLANAGFTLESRTALGSGAWAPVPLGPQIVGGTTWQVTVPTTGSAQFYRLHR